MQQHLMRSIFVIAVFVFAAAKVFAADATFSIDGKRVYACNYDEPKLAVIDLEKQSVADLDLSEFVGKLEIKAVSLSASGNLLFVTERDVRAYSFEKKKCVKLCSAPEGVKFEDLAYNPKDGGILISTSRGNEYGSLYLEKNTSKPLSVVMRRVGYFSGMAFTADGELFFGTRGDLWQAHVEIDKENLQFQQCDLVGWRCAPLATLETQNTTPAQTGVERVAVAGDKLYVHLHRMGGSGWGNIVRLQKFDHKDEDGLKKLFELYAKELLSVETLAENGTASYLCSSPDGKRVFFTTGVLGHDGTQAYLIEDNGKPQELNLRFPKAN